MRIKFSFHVRYYWIIGRTKTLIGGAKPSLKDFVKSVFGRLFLNVLHHLVFGNRLIISYHHIVSHRRDSILPEIIVFPSPSWSMNLDTVATSNIDFPYSLSYRKSNLKIHSQPQTYPVKRQWLRQIRLCREDWICRYRWTPRGVWAILSKHTGFVHWAVGDQRHGIACIICSFWFSAIMGIGLFF